MLSRFALLLAPGSKGFWTWCNSWPGEPSLAASHKENDAGCVFTDKQNEHARIEPYWSAPQAVGEAALAADFITA